jgi:hypothetical protein
MPVRVVKTLNFCKAFRENSGKIQKTHEAEGALRTLSAYTVPKEGSHAYFSGFDSRAPTHRHPTHSLKRPSILPESGFLIIQAPLHDHKRVAFLKLGDVVIEAYESDETAAHTGAIDHFALNVSDIQAVHSLVRSLGYQELENGIQTLPFFSHGVSYFTIQGPNAEKVEFAQYL